MEALGHVHFARDPAGFLRKHPHLYKLAGTKIKTKFWLALFQNEAFLSWGFVVQFSRILEKSFLVTISWAESVFQSVRKNAILLIDYYLTSFPGWRDAQRTLRKNQPLFKSGKCIHFRQYKSKLHGYHPPIAGPSFDDDRLGSDCNASVSQHSNLPGNPGAEQAKHPPDAATKQQHDHASLEWWPHLASAASKWERRGRDFCRPRREWQHKRYHQFQQVIIGIVLSGNRKWTCDYFSAMSTTTTTLMVEGTRGIRRRSGPRT